MNLWQQQWQDFAEDFYDGYAHISLKKYGGKDHILRLLPGAGFGDLSHATTQLMLEMLLPRVENKLVVDIGTGSGILALASSMQGAKKTVGIDICPAAIQHAKQNAKVNKIQVSFSLSYPDLSPNSLFLMNMIFPEQKKVLEKNFPNSEWITSGILEEQETAYLEETKKWGWKLQEMRKKDGWLGFRFSLST